MAADFNGNSRPGSNAERILVMGVGGGGCNALSRMAREWREGPTLVAVDTDLQVLAGAAVENRISLGRNLTRGLSTGGDCAVGKLAAEEDTDALRELISQHDILFIVTALGGGTGGGAAPVVARIAREEGALTIAFATLPFDFEGERKQQQADESLRALRLVADVVVVLPNSSLPEMVGEDTSLLDAFAKADAMIGLSIRSIWRLLSQAGIINLDFADLRQLVESSHGACRFGYGEGTGPNKVTEAMAAVLKSPTLEKGRALSESPALLVNLVGGADMALLDVRRVMSLVKDHAAADARLLMGATVEEGWRDRLAVIVLAAESGHEPAMMPEPVEPTPAKATRNGLPPKVEPVVAPQPETRVVQETLKFEAADKGSRFKNVEPTILDGEDLDLPTFIRRGIKLSFDR
jgi:cell division protein FtsZ